MTISSLKGLLSRRRELGILINWAALAIVTLGLLWIGIHDLIPRINILLEVRNASGDFEKLRAKIISAGKQKTELQKTLMALHASSVNIKSSRSSVAALLHSADTCGLKLEKVEEEISSGESVKGIREHTLSLALRGEYSQVALFIEIIESSPTPSIIRFLNITTLDAVSNKLTCEIRISMIEEP